MNAKNIIVTILVLVLAGAIGYFIINSKNEAVVKNDVPPTTEIETTTQPEVATTTQTEESPTEAERGDETVIGTSVNGSNITAYHFGTGEKELLFIGGIHGGYSWNTALVGYELIDYLDVNPNLIPDDITVTVIPVLNPDGLKATVGTFGRFEASEAVGVSETSRIAGRFNSNDVDLNRNFDCEWSETGTWQNKEVSGGSTPFSEPEAVAIKNYIAAHKPTATVVWFSSEGKVYPSACNGTPNKESITLAATFANAAGYAVAPEFNAYDITGDMVNWMAKQNIPAISVLLTDYKNTEWDKNLAGVQAVISTYSQE